MYTQYVCREPETTTTTPSKMSVGVSKILGVSNRLTIGLAGASFSSCISSELRALLQKLVADELKRVLRGAARLVPAWAR